MSPSGRAESGLGRVVVATDTEAVAEAVRGARLRGGDDAHATTSPAPTASSRRCRRSIPRARSKSSSTSRATCRPSSRRPSARRLQPLEDPAVDIATLGVEIVARGGADQSERRQDRRLAAVGRRGCARSISPAPPRPGAKGRSTITSASMPIAARRSSASSRCRRRRWKGASGWSSCGRSRPACASMPRSSQAVPLGVDTPRRSASAPATFFPS